MSTPEIPATPDYTACPHWGKGGRYVVGADGQRLPVIPEGTVATTEQQFAGTSEPAEAVAGDTVSNSTSTKKGK